MALSDAALTDLSTALDELGLASDGGDIDRRVERYIEAASAEVARYCNRVFQRSDAITESVAGTERTRILLSRRPLIAITSVTVDDAALASSEYKIDSASAGTLFRESGWSWDANASHWITKDPAPGEDDRNIVVVYKAGYVTRAQANPGGTFAGQSVTLPLDLEDAVLQIVSSRHGARGRDPNIKAESLLGASVTYGNDVGGMTESIRRTLDRYRSIIVTR